MIDVLITTSDPRGVTTLTLNRPERRNALDAALTEALLTRLEQIRMNPSTRVVVFTGAGDSFCAGADLQWMRAMADADEATNVENARLIGDLMRAIVTLPQVTLARVQGPAFGGGVGLIAACDIAIAAADVEMSFSEVRLGLIPAMISPVIVNAIGLRATRKLFLTAEKFSGLEAMRLGLVHEAVNVEGLDATIERTLKLLLAAGPEALRACKRLLAADVEHADPETLAAALACLRASEEGREGLAAFLEKRRPHWQGS